MARINIEDSLFKDVRFTKLIIQMGSLETALGCMVRAFIVAQEFWKNGKRPIPKEEWDKHCLAPLLISVGLATETEDGSIYVSGSEKQFEWLIKKQDAGKLGGLKSRRKKVSTAKQRLSNAKLSQPSYSYSYSSSNSEEEESIGRVAIAPAPPTKLETTEKKREPLAGGEVSKTSDDVKAKARTFAAAYVTAYQTRFPGQRPEDLNDGKTRGQILLWIKDYPLDRACQLIQAYMQIDIAWFATKGYDFLTFRNNLQKIAQALDSGQNPSNVDWNKVFGRTA